MSEISDAIHSDFIESIDAPFVEAAGAIKDSANPLKTSDNLGRIAAYAKLENLRRRLEESASEVKAEMKRLEPMILEDMSEHGMKKMSSHGLTIFPKSETYVSKKSNESGATTGDVCNALKRTGFDYLVTTEESYAPSSLKSAIVALTKEGKEVPAELENLLNIGTLIKLGVRKA